MASFGRRLLMGVVGIAVFTVYLAVAGLVIVLWAVVWRSRPDLLTIVGVLVVGSVVVALFSYRVGAAQLLAGLDAAVIPRRGAPELYRRLDGLVARMDVETPQLAVGRLGGPNAFAVAAGDGVIVVDALALAVLDTVEVEALLAHELAHLEGRDAFVQTVAVTLVNTVSGMVLLVVLPVLLVLTGVARGLAWVVGRPVGWEMNPGERVRATVVGLVFVGLAGLTMVVFAHSRRREFVADDRAVEVTGNPGALADALEKLDRAARVPQAFDPLLVRGREESWLGRLFATHPPLERRVRRLRDRSRS